LAGQVFEVTDPGCTLITGHCADIGKLKGPILRGTAAWASCFPNGSAAALLDVVNFYDKRLNKGFTEQQEAVLVAFLNSLCGGANACSEHGADINRSALLIVDMQNDFLHPDGSFGHIAREHPEAEIDIPFPDGNHSQCEKAGGRLSSSWKAGRVSCRRVEARLFGCGISVLASRNRASEC